MQQYREIKARHQDAILFFRMGDFYEMFYDDAELGARVLGITLTARGDGVPLAGVPVKAAAEYLRQLVGAGHRVADLRAGRGPEARQGDRAARSGRDRHARRAAAGRMALGRAEQLSRAWRRVRERGSGAVGLAAVDLSTGEFGSRRVPSDGLAEALAPARPGGGRACPSDAAPAPRRRRALRTPRERWEFDAALAREELARRFALASLDGLGIGPDDDAPSAPRGALLRYLPSCSPAGCRTSRAPPCAGATRLWLDEMTRRNLELVEPLARRHAGAHAARDARPHRDADGRPPAPRTGCSRPLPDAAAIEARLDAVEALVRDAPRPRAAAGGARRRARHRAAGRARRRRARDAARARRPRRLLPPAAGRAEALTRAGACRRAGAPRSATCSTSSTAAPTSPTCSPRALDGPPAGHPRRGRRHPPGLRRGARRAARAPRRRQSTSPRSRAGAGAHRDPVAQGRLQQGVRLLPRDHERAHATGCRPTTSGGRRSPAPSAT